MITSRIRWMSATQILYSLCREIDRNRLTHEMNISTKQSKAQAQFFTFKVFIVIMLGLFDGPPRLCRLTLEILS